ncbi:MAG: hypothetical protein ACRDE2_13400, partial [Chitinophagaceae bacterium]
MKHLTLSIFCMLAVGFIGLSSTGCGTNDVVNQRQNSGLTIGSISSGKVFSSVDQMPIFPGGEEALMQYLSAHIRYPKEAREDGLSGTVIVQFIVNK